MRRAALLRGVNVGGNRKLPMADLKALVEGLGYTDVKTLLASGNVAFSAPEDDARGVEAALERALAAAGVETDVLVRTKPQLEAVLAHNPFPRAARDDPSHYLVIFHRAPVPPAALARLEHIGPEEFAAHGHELYVDFHGFMRDSVLARSMARAKFPKCATGRNWNTVGKLAALL